MGLKNRTILITRPRELSSEFIKAVEEAGGNAVLFPTIRIVDPDSWEGCDEVVRNLQQFDAWIFTSVNGVHRFLDRIHTIRGDVSQRGVRVFAVGEKTREALETKGITVDGVPQEYSSAALARLFPGMNVTGMRFLFPHGDIAKRELVDDLIGLGATVDEVIVYRTVPPDVVDIQALRTQLESAVIDVVTFASPSAARNFARMIPPLEFNALRQVPEIAIIGPTTLAEVSHLGFTARIRAQKATVGGLVKAIEEFYREV